MPTISEVLVQIRGDASELNESLDGAKEHLESFGAIAEGVMQGFGLALGQMSFETLAHSAHHLLEEFIDVNSQAEVWTAQMSLLEGSTAKATERLEGLGKWALKAPFELTDIREANRLLEVFGGDALAGSQGMNLIGDAASFAQKPISEIAELVGRLYQALESGSDDPRAIMTLRKMGVLSGTAAGELTKLVKSHADGTKIWEAFEKAIGRTTGQMDVMMKTYKGQLTNLKDVTHELIHEMGKPFFDGAKDGLLKVLDWLNGPEGHKVQEQLVGLGHQFGEFAKTAGPKFFKEASEGVVKFFDFVSSESGQKTIKTVAELIGWTLKAAAAAFIFGKVFTGIIEPLVMIGGQVFKFVQTLAILGPTMETITVMFPALSAGIELLLGPVGWVIAAVTALWLAWRNNWGHIHEFTADILADVIHWYGKHEEAIDIFVEGLKTAWDFMLVTVTSVWNAVVEVVSAAFEVIGSLVSGAFHIIEGEFDVAGDIITGNWSKAWDDVVKILADSYDMILKMLGSLAEHTLKIVSLIMGWIGHIPGAIGEAAKAASTFLDDQAKAVDEYTKDIGRKGEDAATADEKQLARKLLGLDTLKKAMDKHREAAAGAILHPGSTALPKNSGNDGSGKKGQKEADPNDEVKNKIEELSKALWLNGDASKFADLQFDLLHGSLKGAQPALKAHALNLQQQADKLEALTSANASLKTMTDEYTKTLALGANPTAEATLRYSLLHGELAKGAKAAKDHALAQGLAAIKLTENQEIWKKYHDGLDEIRLKTRELSSEDDALGLSLMGTAKAWDTLNASQQKAYLTAAKGPIMFEALKTQADELTSKLRALRGESPEAILYGNLIKKAEEYMKVLPLMMTGNAKFAASFLGLYRSIKETKSSIDDLAAQAQSKGLAKIFDEATRKIEDDIERLKRSDVATVGERMKDFWDKQRGAIDAYVAKGAGLASILGLLSKLNGLGHTQIAAEDDAAHLKAFNAEMDRVHDKQTKVNEAFSEWVDKSHSAEVAAIQFSKGLQVMTAAQAEQIVKAQEAIDSRAKQVEQIKRLGEKVGDYVGGIFDNIVNGKIKGLFHNAMMGFKALMQDMAAEYLKSQVMKGIMNLASQFAGGITSGGGSGGGGQTNWGESSGGGSGSIARAVGGFGGTAPSMGGAAIRASIATAHSGGGSMGQGSPVNITMHIHTPDAQGFKRSQRQIMSDLHTQAAAAARRSGK